MPFVLPGLFDFATGVTSAIEQNGLRLQNQNQVTDNYLNTLNAFNSSLNTNDNLELRRGFAEQPAGTSILDRFSNFAQQTTNPFAANQALTASAALSPLAALTALQNPAFGASQGIPLNVGNQLAGGFLGVDALLQQQFNQQLPQLLGINNPGLNANTLTSITGANQAAAQQNDQFGAVQARNAELELQLAELRRALATANTARTSTDTMTTTQQPFRPIFDPGRPASMAPNPGQSTATVGGQVPQFSRLGPIQ